MRIDNKRYFAVGALGYALVYLILHSIYWIHGNQIETSFDEIWGAIFVVMSFPGEMIMLAYYVHDFHAWLSQPIILLVNCAFWGTISFATLEFRRMRLKNVQ